VNPFIGYWQELPNVAPLLGAALMLKDYAGVDSQVAPQNVKW